MADDQKDAKTYMYNMERSPVRPFVDDFSTYEKQTKAIGISPIKFPQGPWSEKSKKNLLHTRLPT